MNVLLTSSAVQLARLIRAREVRARDVLEAHIERITYVNPKLNALVKGRFDEARQEAEMADVRVAQEDPAQLPPLLGVPCTIKECLAFTGMPHSSGLISRKDVISQEDAPVVARIRAAGAIPMGVSNLSELCIWMESYNRVYGRTNNPYDLSRTVGGSSGGEGALIGAGASPFGIGSDFGGSIRMPAFFNGIFGHKPSGGLVPALGQYPLPRGAGLRFLSVGPLTRHAEDLMPVLRILAGPTGQEDGCHPIVLQAPENVQLRGLRVLDIELQGNLRVHPDLQRAQVRVASFLKEQGAQVEKISLSKLARSFEIWSSMLVESSGPQFGELLGNGSPVTSRSEFLKWLLRRSPHTLPGIVMVGVEKVLASERVNTRRFAELGESLRAELDTLLSPNTVMLYPSHRYPAPKHFRAMLQPLNFSYTAILNAMELPVTQVPLGLNRERIPLGIQVVAGHGLDHLTIAVALALEQQFGGWVWPSL